MGVSNEAGVKNAKKGIFRNVVSVFTHRNPKNELVWGEDIPVVIDRAKTYGRWVRPENVVWL